jgi:hypothetical protein
MNFAAGIVAVTAIIAVTVGACAPTPSTVSTAQINPCPTNVAWGYPALPQLNNELWQYSQANLGRQVGDGQCAELPNVALRYYGAATFSDLGPSAGSDVDYVWGDLVNVVTPAQPRLINVLPGDVIQFANADFRWSTGNNGYYTSIDTHHTAVVQAVSADGANVCVFQQNASGKLYVTYGFFEVSGITRGVLHVYRPRNKMRVTSR